jgi:transposase
MARGHQLQPVVLSEDEREHLVSLSRRHTSAQAIASRARIILAAAEGGSNLEVADALSISRLTVGKWRSRFLARRLDGLFDEPRPGAPRKITDAQVEKVVTRALETTPKNATHWSTRSLAKATGMSQSAVSRIFRAFALQPHRAETFKLSNDPLFVQKVRDIVGLYLSPPAKAVVLCVDEKTQIQALDRTQPVFPMRPGLPERRTRDYVRHGTTTLFAALDVKSGQVIADCRQRHRASEFVQFLRRIDDAVPKDLDLHVILDNVSTHKTPSVHRWLARPPAVPPPLHPDLCLVDQPGREMVCRDHREANPSGHTQEHEEAHRRHPCLPRRLEQGSAPLRVDQDCRRHPGLRRQILLQDFRLRTLGAQRAHTRARRAFKV